MAWEDVEETIDLRCTQRYWKPQEKGEYVEGNVYDIITTDFNGNPKQIEVWGGEQDEETGELYLTCTSAHYWLQRFIPNIEVGDYIHIEVTDIIPPKGKQKNPTYKYRMRKDPEKFVEFMKEDENYGDDL